MTRRAWQVMLSGIVWLSGSVAAPDAALAWPDYMESWEFSMNVDEDEGPRYAADLIFPLHRGEDNARAVFFEPRLNYANSEYLLNLGGGWRQLVLNRSWLLGGNMFYDYDSTHSHYRLGWGVEALSSYAELRSNFYLGVSQRRLVEETAGTSTFEKAVDGFDVEVGAPVPYYSRLKLFGGYNWYNYEKFKNRYGWTLRTEYTPVPFIVMDGTVSDDTKGNVDWGMTVAFRIPLGGERTELRAPWRPDDTMFPEGDASSQMWRLVERHHEIVVEKYTEARGSINIEIRRGT